MTTSPTPDMSTLSLNTQQRLNDIHDYDGSAPPSARQQYQFSTSPPISAQSHYNPLNVSPSPLRIKPPRSGLPTVRLSPPLPLSSSLTLVPQQWLDNSVSIPENRSLSPNNNSDFSSSGGSPPMGHLLPTPIAPSTPGQNPDDEIIPTAIVIKNIPFNVRRETLLDIIVSPSPTSFPNRSTHHPARHRCRFLPHMPSTTISTSRARSAVWPLPTSARLRTRTPSSLL